MGERYREFCVDSVYYLLRKHVLLPSELKILDLACALWIKRPF